jgi:hypothetical protein
MVMAPQPVPAVNTSVTAPLTADTPGGHAPDSPRDSQSPPPEGPQGDLEMELMGLANALYNLGTTVINDSTKDKDKPGGGQKQVGMRVYVLFFFRVESASYIATETRS